MLQIYVLKQSEIYFSDFLQARLIGFPSPPRLCPRRPLPVPILPQTPVSQTDSRGPRGFPPETRRHLQMLNQTSATETSTPWPY